MKHAGKWMLLEALDRVRWSRFGKTNAEILSHIQSPASNFYICALMWERMHAELRKLERG